ncbi:tyrosine-type recombinase/integrase [Myceligenerans pegani]|uniref:Tyrosine-type recombinase/integrase n=1 Tax=Myceligenerans pegani TaxID=2776917 RepID=A0ABR9MU47_9MICO|nr:tyrosine-type recombinase/integrase [Myceligenerans sp. TRM 65318]MBE1874904.1 tyrosine-type recombinase/integrase [Myceligenerans sp. TRM 65318]MBE3017175.1 tyrosine-type recombinase/integrase [Myceligenerans sp. TRM 65318]
MTGNDAPAPPTAPDEQNPTAEPRYPRPPVTLEEAEWVWRELASEAMRPDAKPETARLAVITGLVRATGARYGDLLRMRVEDLDLGPEAARAGEGVATVRHGKHRVLRRHRLPADLVVLLRHWMSVREELAVELEGSVPRALLLTVHHTHDNGTTVASGLPITRQGLVLSWRRFVHRTNARYGATRPPLPTRFEQVRRAWTESGAGEEGVVAEGVPRGAAAR